MIFTKCPYTGRYVSGHFSVLPVYGQNRKGGRAKVSSWIAYSGDTKIMKGGFNDCKIACKDHNDKSISK